MKKIVSILVALTLALGLVGACAESSALPAYVYPGDDPIWAAIANYMADNGLGFTPEAGQVLIPAPVILNPQDIEAVTDETEELTVYGNFWVFTYALEGRELVCTSGGENPGLMRLKKQDGQWVVEGMMLADEGENYQASIKALVGGDETLLREFALSRDDGYLPQYRRAFILDYVQANNLDVTAFRDPGWDPVSIDN